MSDRALSLLRKTAERTFACEVSDITHMGRDVDSSAVESAVLLPTGVTTRRVFLVGTLAEMTNLGNTEDYWRGRIEDATGICFVHHGPVDATAVDARPGIDPPALVSLIGRPRTTTAYDRSEYVSVYPDHMAAVDERFRNRWVRETATRTNERIEMMEAEATENVARAREWYRPNLERYRRAVVAARATITEPDVDASLTEFETNDDCPT